MKNKKNIFVISPHFWPENFIINDVVTKLSSLKINVSVLTGLPNYPKGEIFSKYKNIRKLTKSKYKKISIFRFPIIPRKKGNLLNLSINYLSFLINGFLAIKKYDFSKNMGNILVYGTTPITTCLLGIYLKKKYKIKLSLWIQDLWPESVKYTGFIKNKFLIYIISLVVKYIYSNCDNLIAQSNSFKKNIKKYSKKKVYVVQNCFLKKKYHNKKIQKKIERLLKENFCLAFAGNIGKAQSIKTLLDAANLIRDFKRIKILIIGDGSEYHNEKKYALEKKLNNVEFLGQKGTSETYKILTKCKGLILTLKKSEIFSLTIPQKFSTYLSIGKPLLIAADGEVCRLTKLYNVGFCGPSENAKKLSTNIQMLFKQKSSYYQIVKKNSQELFRNYFDLNLQTNKLLQIINK
jgi:glycosyltransferase involved in cell wall biosynthesis